MHVNSSANIHSPCPPPSPSSSNNRSPDGGGGGALIEGSAHIRAKLSNLLNFPIPPPPSPPEAAAATCVIIDGLTMHAMAGDVDSSTATSAAGRSVSPAADSPVSIRLVLDGRRNESEEKKREAGALWTAHESNSRSALLALMYLQPSEIIHKSGNKVRGGDVYKASNRIHWRTCKLWRNTRFTTARVARSAPRNMRVRKQWEGP